MRRSVTPSRPFPVICRVRAVRLAQQMLPENLKSASSMAAWLCAHAYMLVTSHAVLRLAQQAWSNILSSVQCSFAQCCLALPAYTSSSMAMA